MAGLVVEQAVEEADEVGPGERPCEAAAGLAGGDVQAGDQRLRAMADMFELAPLDLEPGQSP